ncbi:hypothetical protein EYC80_002317 [Monilinia laxa]|uniref:Uncharacterized protein n=1 Tax=Monilinia laxa TaxID=61186 RepID=A0A5N6K3F0_MONLA|nr:hypothetical protein EYC80_002317 [Monilinia laxa]
MAAHHEPDYSFWQEEQFKRLAIEDELARKEVLIPVTDTQRQYGHLPTFEEKKNEWSDLLKPIMEAVQRLESVGNKENEHPVIEQFNKMGNLVMNSHQDAIRYREKGRVWRGLRNRSEQYILEFRRATQYYFANQSDQPMEAATFRTAVADFHAVISTTLKGLRVVMGQEESEEEVLGAEYDSDGGEPIINLKINHSTPQPFSDLVQSIAEISESIRKRALAASRGASKADLENVKYLGDKLKEKEEQVVKLERENQDFQNARGRPPSHQNCAKEKAEIDRLENELKKARDAEVETRKQFEQANNYIDSVSRGQRVPELPDEVGGVRLRDETFDDLCRHFEGYHANARESLARVIVMENMLRNAVLNAGPASNKKLEEEFKNQKAQADDAIKVKDAIARKLKGQLDQANQDVRQYRANSDALQLQVHDLTTQLDDSVKQFAILQKLEVDAKRARKRAPDEAYRELETERFQLLQQIEDLDTELMIRNEQLDEYRKIVVASDIEIRRLKLTLAWDQDASRNRQEIQDLRERIVAYEHAIEDLVAKNALEALKGSDALNPDNPDEKIDLDNLRLELAKYENKGQTDEEEITNLRTEIGSLDETIDSLNAELEEARLARPEEVDPALAQAHIDLDRRDNQIADLQRQIGVNSARHGQQVTNIQKRLDEARLNANGISPEDLRNIRKNLANCRKQHHDDQETIARLQGDLDACWQRGQLKDERIKKFAQRNADGSADQLQELQDSMQEEIATLEAKLEKERVARDILAEEARVKAEAERERDLKAAADDQAMADESLASFDSNEEVNKEHIAKIRAQGTQMKQMQQEIHQLQYDISSSKAQSTTLEKQRDRLVTQLRQAREELANNQGGEGANADQLAEIALLETQLADLETRLETCEQTGATLQLQRDQAIAQNEEAIANMADLQIAHDTMAGEGPKLGLKRIKTRISNQAKATKARNIATKEAKEAAAARRKRVRAGGRPPPPPKSPPGGGGGSAGPGPGPSGGGAGGAVGGGRGAKVGNQKEQEKEKEEEEEQPEPEQEPESEPEGDTTSPEGRVTRSKVKELEEKKAISAEEKKRLAAEDKQKKDAKAKKKKDVAVAKKEKEKDDAAAKKAATDQNEDAEAKNQKKTSVVKKAKVKKDVTKKGMSDEEKAAAAQKKKDDAAAKKKAAAQKKKDDLVAKKEAAAEKKKNSVAAKKKAAAQKKDDAVANKEAAVKKKKDNAVAKKEAAVQKKKDNAAAKKEAAIQKKKDGPAAKKKAAVQKKKDNATAKKEAVVQKKKDKIAAKKEAEGKKQADDDAKKKKAADDKKKADVAARQKRAAEKLKKKADAIAKKKKEKEDEKKKKKAKEKKGKGGKGGDKKRKDDDDQPDAGTTGGGSGGTAPTAAKKKPSKESGGKGGSAAGTKRPGGDIVEPSSKRPKSDTLNATKEAQRASLKSIVTKSVAVTKAPPTPPLPKTSTRPKTKASGSSSRPTREEDADWNELEEEEDEPLTPGGDEEEDNALEEIIETVSARAIFAAEEPQKSSFATHRPVVRPKVTFNKQKYVLEPESQDTSATLEVLNGIKRGSPPQPDQTKRIKI